jgi:hypothetical protein
MARNKNQNKGKPTISNDNHDENVGQRSNSSSGSQRREHTEEPNTGMRVGGDGNKIHGDDLEELMPGSGKERVRRGAETFDIDGEKVTRVSNANRGDKMADEDAAYESDDDADRGAETFDIGERIDGQRVNRPTRDDGDNDNKGALK